MPLTTDFLGWSYGLGARERQICPFFGNDARFTALAQAARRSISATRPICWPYELTLLVSTVLLVKLCSSSLIMGLSRLQTITYCLGAHCHHNADLYHRCMDTAVSIPTVLTLLPKTSQIKSRNHNFPGSTSAQHQLQH